MTRKELIQDLLKKYKELIALNRLKDEKYKWALVHDFKGRPNLDTSDFEKEVLELNYVNLL